MIFSAQGCASAGAAGWQTSRIGTDRFTGVSCPSVSFCAAVDSGGNVWTSSDPAGGPAAWQSALKKDELLARILVARNALTRERAAEARNLQVQQKTRLGPLVVKLGFTDRKLSDALVQLYAAALRGLAIDALQRDKSDLDEAVELLKRYHRLLLEQIAPVHST